MVYLELFFKQLTGVSFTTNFFEAYNKARTCIRIWKSLEWKRTWNNRGHESHEEKLRNCLATARCKMELRLLSIRNV
jgi:hypothetical protein